MGLGGEGGRFRVFGTNMRKMWGSFAGVQGIVLVVMILGSPYQGCGSVVVVGNNGSAAGVVLRTDDFPTV